MSAAAPAPHAEPREADVVYDWNRMGDTLSPPLRRVKFVDETLRDGIQCPSVTDPGIEDKKQIVRLLSAVGVDHVDVGLPGAGPRAVADVQVLTELIRDEKLPILPQCAARTHANDIRPVIEISERTGVPIEVMAFLGTSPIRLYAEGWDEAVLEQRTRESVRMAKQAGLPCTFVTEDTIRSHPETLRRLFTAAIEEGADGLCVCDTVGHATPNGVFNLVHYTRTLIRSLGTQTRVDWHGHNDRGFGLGNALSAIEAGADRVHGTVLGMGERVGNTPLDLFLVNLRLLGVIDNDLSRLAELVDLASQACVWPIPVNYPVFGKDAFRTGTGVHAAAVIKALKKGHDWLADSVYSGVPARWFGRSQQIEIGHMAGDSNILYWLSSRGLPTTPELVGAIRDRAKSTARVLDDAEVMEVVERVAAHS
ncbi:MAG: 2-isopropylmalate synthase [Deltaproteobacteria bacterium]|jgi:2-isopropylmalate synthase|nr:2-isopropylmalate synthase [Deltaproteobacteria bacterium]